MRREQVRRFRERWREMRCRESISEKRKTGKGERRELGIRRGSLWEPLIIMSPQLTPVTCFSLMSLNPATALREREEAGRERRRDR